MLLIFLLFFNIYLLDKHYTKGLLSNLFQNINIIYKIINNCYGMKSTEKPQTEKYLFGAKLFIIYKTLLKKFIHLNQLYNYDTPSAHRHSLQEYRSFSSDSLYHIHFPGLYPLMEHTQYLIPEVHSQPFSGLPQHC